MSRYDVKSILESSTLPIGGAAKRLKDAEQAVITADGQRTDEDSLSSQLTDGISSYGALAFQQAQPNNFTMNNYPYAQRAVWCKQEQDLDNSHVGGYQDIHHHPHNHQYQTATNTHNFFQQPNSVLHNLMGMDSASMEHSSGSNSSVVYSNNGDNGYGSNINGGGGYVIPMATVISNENQNHGNGMNIGYYENLFGSSDPYHGRNLYYLSQQQSAAPVGVAKAGGGYDQGSACNNWVPTAVPTIGPRSSNMAAVCHGAQTFTVWNDT